MALVDRPINNLQLHLAWFNSQKPQVPPVGQNLVSTLNTANLPDVVSTTVLPTGRDKTVMPTPANMRNSTLAAPRRSEMTPRRQDSHQTSSAPSTNVVGKSVVDRFKNHVARQGNRHCIWLTA
jgi:hypothetical protein